jgi:hypothetical protein
LFGEDEAEEERKRGQKEDTPVFLSFDVAFLVVFSMDDVVKVDNG